MDEEYAETREPDNTGKEQEMNEETNEKLEIPEPTRPTPKEGQVDIGSMGQDDRLALYEEWKKKARECTPDTVGDFIRHLVDGHCHDYDSIATALSVAALAGAWAVERSKQGGLTGFQWGWASHRTVAMMCYENSKFGIRIQDMDHLLYPQYAGNFAFVKVDRKFAEKLRAEAQRLFESKELAAKSVRGWWAMLANGDFPTWLRVED